MKEQDKISMLLDINNFYGEHEGRLGPIIKFLCIGAAPVLLWVYLNFIIPAWAFFPLWIFFVFRTGLIVLGREKERLVEFKKQLNDVYSSSSDLLNIRTLHEDGGIEYINGAFAYMVVTANGTTYNDTDRAQLVKAFIDCFGKDYNVDVYVQNITEAKSLESRYRGVKLFADAEAAQDFIDIIDHNRKIVCSTSLLTRVVFVVKGRKSDWKDIKHLVTTAVYSGAAKAFKDAHIADRYEVEEIISRDINGIVNIDEILEHKYANGTYHDSRVLYYDDKKKQNVTEVDTTGEECGFMVSE